MVVHLKLRNYPSLVLVTLGFEPTHNLYYEQMPLNNSTKLHHIIYKCINNVPGIKNDNL